MGQLKKIAIGAALIIIAGAAIIFAVRYTFRFGGPQSPQWLQDTVVEKIDTETLEIVAKTMSEWENLGYKGCHYKNPNTGQYTMTTVILCGACGEKIPPPNVVVDPKNPNPQLDMNYKCPKCGGAALPPRPQMPTEPVVPR